MSLKLLLNRLGEQVFDLYDVSKVISFIIEEVQRKHKQYPFWQKKIRFSYASYLKNKHKNQDKNFNDAELDKKRSYILKYFYHDDKFSEEKKLSEENLAKILPVEPVFTSLSFFQKKFNEFFSYYLTSILPFKEKNLKYRGPSFTFYKDMEITYQYSFLKEELDYFKEFQQHYMSSESVEKSIEYIFWLFVSASGFLIGQIVHDNFVIELNCGRVELSENPRIIFIVGVRQKESIMNDFYFKTELFHFSEFFSDKLPKETKDKLKTEKNLIYLNALDRYSDIEPYILSMLERMYNKCYTLQSITPILDLLNFVASRVEDSIYDTNDLLDEVFQKFSIDGKIKEIIIQLYNYCSKNSSLFSMFQSNNRPQMNTQYTLSLLLMQYFFIDPDAMYLKDVYGAKQKELYNKNSLYSQFDPLFRDFILKTNLITHNSAVGFYLKRIFNKGLSELNEHFICVFMNTVNVKFFQDLDDLNKKFPDYHITFDFFLENLVKIIFHMIKKVFLAPSPEIASQNFYDKLGRYSPKRIALRTLEILMFKEMPLSDNSWQHYLLSRNKKKVAKAFQNYLTIPDDYFFSQKALVHINMMYIFSIDKTELLENWTVDNIQEPFYVYCFEIFTRLKNKVRKEQITDQNQIFKILNQIIFDYLSQNVINQEVLENLELISEWNTEMFIEIMNRIL